MSRRNVVPEATIQVPRVNAAPRVPAAHSESTSRERRGASARAVRGSVRVMRPARGGLGSWLRAIRVRQWPKNLFVFGAPAAAGALARPGVAGRVTLAALAFCLLSSGAYLLNDLRDAPEDRKHPVKRHRPIASRAIAPS